MGLDELRRVAGDLAPTPSGGDCQYVRPAGLPKGVTIMLVGGQVVRIDVDSAGVRTNDGAGVGDTESRVRQLYSGQIRAMPHKYVPGASYLVVTGSSPGDSAYRIIFETENGRVTRYRAGRVPEVEWVERCG